MITAAEQRAAMSRNVADPRATAPMSTVQTNVRPDPFRMSAESLRTLHDLAIAPPITTAPTGPAFDYYMHSPCARFAELIVAVTVKI